MSASDRMLGRGDRIDGLCQLVSDFNGKIPVGGAIIEPKIDGIRMLWIDGQLVTRDGVPILGAEHIATVLRHLEHKAVRTQFFDGEWQVAGSFEATLRHFQSKGAVGDAGIFHIFDHLDMEGWRLGGVEYALSGRRRQLERMVEPLGPKAAVRLIPWGWTDNAEDAQRAAAEVIAAGGEGVIVKHANSTYQKRRSSNWMRIKKAPNWDGVIVDLIARQENGDQLATMVVDVEGNKALVSDGFTDRQRFDFMLTSERLIGRWVEVELAQVAPGQRGEHRFLRLKEGC